MSLIRSLSVYTVALGFLAVASSAPAQLELGSSFTHQGSLRDAGAPASGTYDFRFTLADAVSGGNTIAGPVTVEDVVVSGGIYSVSLDFGDVFQGDRRWLTIEVRRDGDAGFTTLSPRQEITPVPYAIYADNAGSATTAVTATTATTADSTTGISSSVVQMGPNAGFNGAGFAQVNGLGSINTIIANEESSTEHGRITLHNEASLIRSELTVLDGPDVGFLRLRGDNGSANVLISVTNNDNNDGRIVLLDADETETLRLFSAPGDGGRAVFRDDDGGTKVDIQSDPIAGGRIDVLSPTENSVAQMVVIDDPTFGDGGGFKTFTNNGVEASEVRSFDGRGGRILIRSGTGVANFVAEASGVANNLGYAAILDSNGSQRAGFNFNNGGAAFVFSDFTKSAAPTDESKSAWHLYSNPVGNEASVYERGKVTLEAGKGLIQPGQSFLDIANTETMTVHLTPLSGLSGGVAVDGITDKGIHVVDLDGNSETYEASYMIMAERIDIGEFEKSVTTKSGVHPFANGSASYQKEGQKSSGYVPHSGESVQ